ncbi:phosphoheptose isomerase [Candidatus Desantisbacteria bacterium CG2_30_40_21]|uniref:Phosphoheptose isomerase n=4 Tax=unclassified Candidatus Desantisiibacteriota TaxID=3106372 RepID=A0A2M7JCS0_9BACT|nr:MAG: phosphoheptose isomerase [Candidatus Desantisbacteria bacterium CG2_30_40_21]PIP40177.1 MAG: phosphoheptose isomerase [Candidatus Desantisbacteria bacterium CG23_combo_of_CG06-09_8_20_14_all_40_23]PIX17212.1 MAG: phosphoheptose isomerase [Candidatus Desantisbacteria bacterium CG_4_8_14_3_um_filter_40_12]PIY19795.1 MAG: phosphoheptose isomerase [Candidatus Desantisbacteria bacterium CG_4_10_14_3_um_filter_40_18]
MEKIIIREIQESIEVKNNIPLKDVALAAEIIINAYRQNKKVLICGNGGSAADAQHMTGELVGRFKMEREALGAIALTTDTSILTAIGNDYGFEDVFSRQIEALTESGDVVIGISTSGNSPNVLKAIAMAKKKSAVTIGLTGGDGGKLKDLTDVCIVVSSSNTPRIQESHITIIHIICLLVEQSLFGGR